MRALEQRQACTTMNEKASTHERRFICVGVCTIKAAHSRPSWPHSPLRLLLAPNDLGKPLPAPPPPPGPLRVERVLHTIGKTRK